MHHHLHHSRRTAQAEDASTKGLILRGGWRYDLTSWVHEAFSFRGTMRALRQKTVALAQVQSGEAVLDVGCGTGTLLLNVARQVGGAGRMAGLDPSAGQIARARAKAVRSGLSIEFQIGVIEQLPFASQTFDVVFSTLMMHHLPAPLKRKGLIEIARVLRPDGRLVIADFTAKSERTGRSRRFHAGGSRVQDLVTLLADAGFAVVETEYIPALRFSAFPGASIMRASRNDGRQESTEVL